MGQQQFRVRVSLRTKILAAMLLLSALLVVLLDLSTYVLLREGNRNQISEALSLEVALTARDFAGIATRAGETLRSGISLVRYGAPKEVKEGVNRLINSQSTLLAAAFFKIDRESKELGIGRSLVLVRDQDNDASRINTDKLDLIPRQLQTFGPALKKGSLAFMNLGTSLGNGFIGVIATDKDQAELPGGAVVGLGVFQVRKLAAVLSGTDILDLAKTGDVLLDSRESPEANRRSRLEPAEDPLFAKAVSLDLTPGLSRSLEFDHHRTHFLGSYMQPGLDLVALGRLEWSAELPSSTLALEQLSPLANRFGFFAAIALALAALFGLLLSHGIRGRVLKLIHAMDETARGNVIAPRELTWKDELGALADRLKHFPAGLGSVEITRDGHAPTIEERSTSLEVYQSLVPPNSLRSEKIFIRSCYSPSPEFGGDWWGFFGAGNRLCLLIGDANAEGLPAAVVVASVRSCFSLMAKLSQEDPGFRFSPSAMLQQANRVIFDAAKGKSAMTLFAGVIDFEAGTCTFSSGGLQTAWLFQKDASGRYSSKNLSALGTRLGELRDVTPFEEKRIQLNPGDILLLHTDGLTDARNPNGDAYGKSRMRTVVENSVAGGPDRIATLLTNDFNTFRAGKAPDDDVTFVVAQIFPPPPEAGRKPGSAPAKKPAR
jgi:hypothetical protein